MPFLYHDFMSDNCKIWFAFTCFISKTKIKNLKKLLKKIEILFVL